MKLIFILHITDNLLQISEVTHSENTCTNNIETNEDFPLEGEKPNAYSIKI